MRKPRRPPDPGALALRLLARREHGRQELARKLAVRGCADDAISAVLDELAAAGYQSDARYAESLTRQRHAQGRGPRWVQYELEQAGVAAALIEKALAQEGLDWLQAGEQACRRVSLRDGDIFRLRQKLVGRGFEPEQARAIAESALIRKDD